MTSSKVSVAKETVVADPVFVDGLGVGDISTIVLRDRRLLSESGLIIIVATLDSYGNVVAGPDIISRGFVYVKENEELIDEVRMVADQKLHELTDSGVKDWATLKNAIRDDLSRYIYRKTERKPVILTIFMEA
jgi:ribonuclease J